MDSAKAAALVIMTLYDGLTLAAGLGVASFDWVQVMDAAEILVLRGLGVNESNGVE